MLLFSSPLCARVKASARQPSTQRDVGARGSGRRARTFAHQGLTGQLCAVGRPARQAEAGPGADGVRTPVWGGKGCGGRGRVCTVTQAGGEAGFEAVTRGGGHVVAAALRNPRGFGAAAGGVSLLKPGFPRGLSVLPATHKGQGWRWGGSPRGPQGIGWDPQKCWGFGSCWLARPGSSLEGVWSCVCHGWVGVGKPRGGAGWSHMSGSGEEPPCWP